MAKSNKRISQHIGGNKGNIFAEKLNSANLEKTMIVPIEIGRSHHKSLIANYLGSIFREPFTFHNSQEGINSLHNTISKISRENQIKDIFIGLEATGHYYKIPASEINRLGYDNLFVLNPLSTAQFRKAGLTWSKTDNIDLGAIGQALISGYGTIYRPEQPLWEDLRQLCRYRRFEVKHQTALKNKIHAILDSLVPGIFELQMFKNPHLWHPASLDFFTKYPNVNAISGLRPSYIAKLFQNRGRRITPEDSHQLIRWSKQTFNIDSPINTVREEILKSLISELKQLSQNISQLEVKILGYLVKTPAVLLLSINYIGPIRAGEFAGEITPFEQFPNSRALIKAAGLDSTNFQSTTRESTDHPISKKGSRNLRYITIDIADALMKHNGYFAFFAKQLIARGKSKDCACVATANRFIRVAFWMIKEQRSFQPPNGLGIVKDPLTKIQLFLVERHASHLIEEYVNLAKKYFNQSQPKGGNINQ